jgi:hypothetical protein
MLWIQIVAALVLLTAATYLIQWLVPRNRSKGIPRRQYLRWDVAPIAGFFAALLLALSFAEAARREVIAPWGWGLAFGLIVSIGAWVLLGNRGHRAARQRASLWHYLRRYGTPVIATVIGLYLAVRVFGSALGVFIAAAIGVVVMAAAVAMFVGNKQPIHEENNGK